MKKPTSTNRYEKGQIAVNAVILTIHDQSLSVYLEQREKDPYLNLNELPGGLLLANETAEATLARKLEESIGKRDIYFQQFYTFTSPKRDPRERTISIGFIALLPKNKIEDVTQFQKVTTLPQLAFDHNEIISKAINYLKENMNIQIIKQFMPQDFPLNELQIVYELIGQKKLDNRNFRKKMLDSGVVKQISKKQQNVTHRPATLYKFS